jgi:two-component system, cell cycle response regulator
MLGRLHKPSTFPREELKSGTRSGVVPAVSKTDLPPSSRAPQSVRLPKHDLPRLWDDEQEELTSPTLSVASPMDKASGGAPCLTVMNGGSAGQVIRLEASALVIGRSRTADLGLLDEGVSRQHCRVTRRGATIVVEDLGSTNGTFVNGARIEGNVTLEAGDRIRIGAAVLQLGALDSAEETLARKLFDASTRDPLTSAYNRHFFLSRLEAEMSYAQRHTTSLSVLLLDVDGMAALNAAHGRSAGDEVLRAVVQAIGAGIRTEDLFCRYGGDEFAFLLREPLASATRTGERLRLRLEHLRVQVGRKTIQVTGSIGAVEVGEPGAQLTGEGLLRVAERRLHRAKLLGGNRVAAE